jgi:hypothetical protein
MPSEAPRQDSLSSDAQASLRQPGASSGHSCERRTLCLLCAGRCDPWAWTCRACHRRIMAMSGLIDEMLAEANVGAPTSSINHNAAG